jgi:hypothetical protein
VPNANPPLAAGQVISVTHAATGMQIQIKLPPFKSDHIFLGEIPFGKSDLEGFHHFTANPGTILQRQIPLLVLKHQVVALDAHGNPNSRIVDMRITPAHASSQHAPFQAKVDVLDRANHTNILAYKTAGTFFPIQWAQGQVVQAIYQAYVNYVRDRALLPIGIGLSSVTDANVRMMLHVRTDKSGNPDLIYSSYPNGPQTKVGPAHAP